MSDVVRPIGFTVNKIKAVRESLSLEPSVLDSYSCCLFLPGSGSDAADVAVKRPELIFLPRGL